MLCYLARDYSSLPTITRHSKIHAQKANSESRVAGFEKSVSCLASLSDPARYYCFVGPWADTFTAIIVELANWLIASKRHRIS